MRIVVAQLNPVVGDIAGNLAKAEDIIKKSDADLVVFPELFLTGYPPLDLLQRKEFLDNCDKAVETLVELSKNVMPGILVGAPVRENSLLFNSAILIDNGKISRQHKSLLPTYDVFDESRYFSPAKNINPTNFRGEKIGLTICEDAWNDKKLWPNTQYNIDPVAEQVNQGATLIVNISASPFYVGKDKIRYDLITSHSLRHKIPILFVNQVGGNDELLFDGRSMVVNGENYKLLAAYKEDVQEIDTAKLYSDKFQSRESTEEVYDALVLGIKDYTSKCGFSKVIVGCSGGVDSAVTLTLAVDALGKENVLAVHLPSEYSSEESKQLSEELAKNLGIKLKTVAISSIYNSFKDQLKNDLQIDEVIDTTLENLQARIRGVILMSFANKFGYLVLSTGNKSEFAVGYCTLYGDLTGGLSVLSDVPKTTVYSLANLINKNKERIPVGIITRPPSAELKPGQKDQDILPDYNILDQVIHKHLEENMDRDKLVKIFDKTIVDWILSAIEKSEYKRRQAPPGIKVTSKAFGRGRSMPIARK